MTGLFLYFGSTPFLNQRKGGAYPGVDFGSKEDLKSVDIFGNIGIYMGQKCGFSTSHIPIPNFIFSKTPLFWVVFHF